MLCDEIYEVKTLRTTILMLVIHKNYEYLNKLQGAVFLKSQTNFNIW